MTGALRPAALRAHGVLRGGLLASTHIPKKQSLTCPQYRPWQPITAQSRGFSTSPATRGSDAPPEAEKGTQRRYDKDEAAVRKNAQKQVDDRPWHRVGSHSQLESTSPDPSGNDQSKGRLLTTPTRLLKLILPMPFHPQQRHINPDEADEAQRELSSETVEPLALLVHPQQPLSYLERLIQAEIPPLLVNNTEKLPDIVFRAEADREENRRKQNSASHNVASYSGLGREGPDKSNGEVNWVRWSGSTEVGDFIRDAARGREFAVDIEGYPRELRVAVPSFKDRTYYMRMRLRRMSREINDLAKVKNDCDQLAHKGAHRIAKGGFAALAGWWGIVYYITFHTEMGWDLVEPVTYLAGLTTIMGGYLWFLYMSRDLSYKAAMNLTVSRRQDALYQERGFDMSVWEHLVHEANSLRKEIKMVAGEYDVGWNEMKDLGGEEVKEALESEEKQDGKEEGKEKKQENDKAEEKKTPEEKKG